MAQISDRPSRRAGTLSLCAVARLHGDAARFVRRRRRALRLRRGHAARGGRADRADDRGDRGQSSLMRSTMNSYAAINNSRDAVALSNAVLPAAARCFQFYLYVIFALAERKNDIRTEG